MLGIGGRGPPGRACILASGPPRGAGDQQPAGHLAAARGPVPSRPRRLARELPFTTSQMAVRRMIVTNTPSVSAEDQEARGASMTRRCVFCGGGPAYSYCYHDSGSCQGIPHAHRLRHQPTDHLPRGCVTSSGSWRDSSEAPWRGGTACLSSQVTLCRRRALCGPRGRRPSSLVVRRTSCDLRRYVELRSQRYLAVSSCP